MATFKTIVRYKRADGFYQVYIRVLHRSKSGYIKTDKFVTDKQASSFAELCSLIILSIHILRKMDRKVYGLNWQFNKNIFHHVCRTKESDFLVMQPGYPFGICRGIPTYYLFYNLFQSTFQYLFG